jgi:hypothetical protein
MEKVIGYLLGRPNKAIVLPGGMWATRIDLNEHDYKLHPLLEGAVCAVIYRLPPGAPTEYAVYFE